MHLDSSQDFSRLLERTLDGEDLESAVTEAVLQRMLAGEVDAHWLAGWLVALRAKGETAQEIAGMARAMRAHATPVGTTGRGLLDTCGTGGDGSNTFNVSTACAFVAAGAGARVAKHGNRSVSSRCGSADVLEALGGRVQLAPEDVGRCIDEVGFGFLFAPALHGAMRHAMPARRALGVRTVFNVLGPLTNPAGAEHQVIGVFAPEWTARIAGVLAELGARSGLVVHGRDGLDELSVSAVSDAVLVEAKAVREVEIDPAEFGLGPHARAEIEGGDASTNARLVRGVLDGSIRGAPRDIVLLNSAAALWITAIASDVREGIERARESIDSGAARDVLDRWVDLTRRSSPPEAAA